jgi:two-component system, NarL family, nitrate/nitrite response regulator NarL
VTIILAAPGEAFRARAQALLRDAGYLDVQLAESAGALRAALSDAPDPLVLAGDDWPLSRPLLRQAVRADAPAILLLRDARASTARVALSCGASGVLDLDVRAAALATALDAVRSGLRVLDRFGPAPEMSSAAAARWRELPESSARSAVGASALTARERQALALIASGTSNKGIARVLGVSVNTVKFHLAAAFSKLEVTTRAEAVAEAMRRGEIAL